MGDWQPPWFEATALAHDSNQSGCGAMEKENNSMAVALVSKPIEPVHDGTMLPPVVRFTKFDGYSYAAIRTPDGTWFTTQDPGRYGNQRIFPMTWADLLDWLGERNWSSLELLT